MITTRNQPAPASSTDLDRLDVAVLSTPVGPLVVFGHGGVVVTSGFGTVEDVRRMLPGDLANLDVREGDGLTDASEAVAAYCAGHLDALTDVAVTQPGGPFLTEVWAVMREIPAGQTWSYAELATKAGRPAAVRAAGQGCATNRVAPFVPCHRVVRSDGSLGGYAYGLATKQGLLDYERGFGDQGLFGLNAS